MKKIGLTGGIGVGKTFVSKLFNQLGFPVFNADFEAKKCMVSDLDLMKKIKLIFGNVIYIDGKLQKEILADIVFSDTKKLNELNELVHPVVKQRFFNWCEKQESAIVLKEAAILFESNSHIGLDHVICVTAPEDIRIKRLQQRDNESINQLKGRIGSQMKQSDKEKLSDYIIVNDGVELILPQVIKILSQIS
jgi:dephospho-CoA kinase